MSANRYVILRHKYEGIHYDLMLEVGDALRSWRLEQPPQSDHTQQVEESFYHRLIYLDYEGEVTNNRGFVTQWDRGTYQGDADDEKFISIQVEGEQLSGELHLKKCHDKIWELRYHPQSDNKYQ